MMMISPALVGAYVPGLSLQQPRVQQQSIQMGVESMCLPARSLHSLRRGAGRKGASIEICAAPPTKSARPGWSQLAGACNQAAAADCQASTAATFHHVFPQSARDLPFRSHWRHAQAPLHRHVPAQPGCYPLHVVQVWRLRLLLAITAAAAATAPAAAGAAR